MQSSGAKERVSQRTALESISRVSGAPGVDCADIFRGEHFVQFYESDSFLVDSVARFAARGFEAGEKVILFVTPEHRDAIKLELIRKGLEPDILEKRGHYQCFEALEALGEFMVNGLPDPDLFCEVVGSKLAEAGNRVRAFGEMVALLLEEGNPGGALELENLWNKLSESHSFSLLCAYPMAAFQGEEKSSCMLHVCEAHSRVIPAESYGGTSAPDGRLRDIALLQQKAQSLQSEVAERRRAECALREQKTRLTVATTIANLGVWELDLVTNKLSCSEACREHFVLNGASELDFQMIINAAIPEDRPGLEAALKRAIEENIDFSEEFRVMEAGTVPRWIAAMGRCFHNGTHRMLGVTVDITSRKRAEELLESAVAERTAQLQSTVEELEAFSYSISHDMRAPLRSMCSFADILSQECNELKNEHREYLERIASSGRRMDQLIQDILTFSRVTRAELDLEPVNLSHLLHGIIECYPSLQRSQADITIEGPLPLVFGNAAALTQCFSNLLGNAVKFVERGTQPKIRIWAEQIGAENEATHSSPLVRINMKDNGIGIAPADQEKIFGIFQRVSKQFDGTGIGLSIVKKAAERMGGKVGVISDPGAGSLFWLELPMA